MNGSVCNGTIKQLSSRVFQCTLKETFRIQVQPGDILGLELPPTSDDDFEMFFTSGGPTNYVFQNQISSEAVLSSRASEVQEQPQINITVEALATSGMRNLYYSCTGINIIWIQKLPQQQAFPTLPQIVVLMWYLVQPAMG